MLDYVELHCHSYYSLLDGASSPEDLAKCAGELGMSALALTDHDAVYGASCFIRAAQSHGIRPIVGAELTLREGHHLTLLVENEVGWRNLCRLISCARHHAPKGEASLPPEELAGHTAGLIALSGCYKGEIAALLARGDQAAAFAAGGRYRDLFGPDQFWLELQHHLLPDEDKLVYELVEMSVRLGLRCVATNDVHYATRDGHRLQDVLCCIHQNVSLNEAGPALRPNSEFYLKPARRMAALFAEYPQALANTQAIAERCNFELRYGVQDLPVFTAPAGMDAAVYLRQLCEARLPAHYSGQPSRARDQLAHELEVIDRVGLNNYFLIVWDVVHFARSHGILCQGRGSAANSLVAYLLDITPIDPLAHALVFERFLSEERAATPDIDIDFQADRREEVIQYIYQRYGAEHAAMACTLVTFRLRSAVRDVGKALGLPLEVVQRAAEFLSEPEPADREQDSTEDSVATLVDLARQIDGLPRHLGIHNGGMVLMGAPLAERVPTEPATMPDRVVVQWDKEVLEDVGLVKIDILGLRMLSAIAETVRTIEAVDGQAVDLNRLTFDDPAIYEMVGKADTIGIFQVESRAQAQVLPRLKPTSFEDLIVSISLIRPGPLQGNMVHPYLRRRSGVEPVSYAHPALESALAETLGVILYQEQVLKVSRDMAGFTPGQGEQLRRILGGKRPHEEIEGFRGAFLAGALARGVSELVAHTIFDQLKAFGGYSFPKSHAAAFAVLVYRSAWLKLYHPAVFFAALLNHQPMGFWSPAVLVGDARRHAVEVLPVHIDRSRAGCTVENGNIRLGFKYVDGLGETSIARLEATRTARRFSGLVDFCKRTRLARRLVENLILVGAMDGWGIQRRKLLWELNKLRYQEDELDLVFSDESVDLPAFTPAEEMGAEYSVLGLSAGDHIMALYRSWLNEHGILDSKALERCADGQQVRVAGLDVMHQAPPTAKGHHFITLEDEEGMVNVIVRPAIYEEYRRVLRAAPLLIIEGTVQRKDGITNLLALRAAPIPSTESQASTARAVIHRVNSGPYWPISPGAPGQSDGVAAVPAKRLV